MSTGLGAGVTGVAKGCSAVLRVLSSPDIGPDICFAKKMEKKNLGVTNSPSCLVLIGMLAFFRVALKNGVAECGRRVF